MSGAVRAARAAGRAVGTRREADVPVLAVVPPRRTPRATCPGTNAKSLGAAANSAHVSLVSPTDAAMHCGIVTAAVGLVSGSSGTANAGVC
jgi:hypothetical protein